LLRSLRRLHKRIAKLPASRRQETITKLSRLLREELLAFIVHQKANGASFHSSTSVDSTRHFFGSADQSQLWLCSGSGRESAR
jgi:hypothetical protein